MDDCRTARKDPDAVLPYGFDWARGGANDGSDTDRGWLQGGTIVTSTWEISDGDGTLIMGTDQASATATSVTLSGGTAGVDYTLTNRITTAAGLTDDRSILIQVRER